MKRRPASYSKRKAKATGIQFPYTIIKKFKPLEVDPIISDIRNRKKGDPIRKALINYIIERMVSILE